MLIYPIWIQRGGRGKLQRMLPPLGVLSLAAAAENAGFKVAVLDMHGEQTRIKELRQEIARLQPRIVGMTVLSNHLAISHHISHHIKDVCHDSRIFVGGVHAETYPEHLLSNPHIEGVCIGDGEELIVELLKGVAKKEIKGLVYKKQGHLIYTPPRKITMQLDRRPPPAYHMIDFKNYYPGAGTYKRLPAMNLMMTRGCPGQCHFCNSANTVLRSRSPEAMFDLIKMLRQKHKIKQFTFYDDTFTAHRKNVKKLCQLLIADATDISFVCYARGDMFDEEMAALLKQAGCHHLLLGIETACPKLAEGIGKNIPKEQYKKVVNLAHKYKIEVRGAFIIGHREETLESLQSSLDLAIELDLDYFQPSVLTPYPGTQLYAQAEKEDWLLHRDFSRYGQNFVVMAMKNLKAEQIYAFERRAMRTFYLRPKMILRLISRIRTWYQIADLFNGFKEIVLTSLRRKNTLLKEWEDFDTSPFSQQNPTERITWKARRGRADGTQQSLKDSTDAGLKSRRTPAKVF